MPLLLIRTAMEDQGMLVDTGYLQTLSSEVRERLEAVEEEILALAGHELNQNSHPQLSQLLFEELGLPMVETTPSGKPSTKNAVLEKLEGEHPIVALLLEQRELSKLQGSFIEKLIQLADAATGRVRSSYSQLGARTGRLSSSRPNLQNIPARTEVGQSIRKAFIAPEGHMLLACDYSQIEIRVMAHLSRDPELCAAFERGEDVRATPAAAVFEVPLDEVTDEQRQLAKAVNFGLMYGMSARGLSERRGLTVQEAEGFIEAYFARFRGVRAYRKHIVERARQEGGASTILGRQRPLPGISSEDSSVQSKAVRRALNSPIQGSAADILKLAMVHLDRRLHEEGLDARMILQVHDEIILEVPDEELDAVIALTVEAMADAYPLRVPLEVEAKVGRNWVNMEVREPRDEQQQCGTTPRSTRRPNIVCPPLGVSRTSAS